MRLPLAGPQVEIAEQGSETGVLRRTGINAEADAPAALQQMADPHLGKVLPILGALDTIIVLPAAQTVPHGFYRRVDGRGGPVGIAMISHYAAQVLVSFVFIFHGGFEPVLAVQIERHATLVEPVMALGKIGLYDNNFCLNGTGLRKVATLQGKELTMEVETSCPGMQIYSATFGAPKTGKGGAAYEGNCFVCLETQAYPDALNHPNFPSTLVPAGGLYRQTTVYRVKPNK